MTEVIVKVHSVHSVNVEQRQAAANPQTKPLPDLSSQSACFRQLSPTTTAAIYYYYSALKLSTSLT